MIRWLLKNGLRPLLALVGAIVALRFLVPFFVGSVNEWMAGDPLPVLLTLVTNIALAWYANGRTTAGWWARLLRAVLALATAYSCILMFFIGRTHGLFIAVATPLGLVWTIRNVHKLNTPHLKRHRAVVRRLRADLSHIRRSGSLKGSVPAARVLRTPPDLFPEAVRVLSSGVAPSMRIVLCKDFIALVCSSYEAAPVMAAAESAGMSIETCSGLLERAVFSLPTLAGTASFEVFRDRENVSGLLPRLPPGSVVFIDRGEISVAVPSIDAPDVSEVLLSAEDILRIISGQHIAGRVVLH
ncbi:MAG: hypothetical protein ACTSPE_10150 [Candidatus Thorarchaeota archaeon]